MTSPGESPDDSEYKAFLTVLASSARGRAFLAEHARRARQADTEMLLAALARIEDMLAEQRARTPRRRPRRRRRSRPARLRSPPSPRRRSPPRRAICREVKVIKAGSRPPPPHFSGEDFAGAAAEPAPKPRNSAADLNVIAETVPPEHAAPPGTPVADALGHILALSEEERLALFS